MLPSHRTNGRHLSDITNTLNNIAVNENGKNKKKHFTVAVEGNIGSGKSTFLQHFEGSSNVEIFAEPVDMWKDVAGHNLLELMYKDANRWSLTFQSYVQLTMLETHCKKQLKPVKIMERSIFSSRYCFVENLYQRGCMPGVDHAVLEEWYQWILTNKEIHLDLIVYLRADPEVCLERIKKRNRKEEAGVPLSYLVTLHNQHEDWLINKNYPLPAPVLVLDGNKDLSILRSDFEEKRNQILCGYC